MKEKIEEIIKKYGKIIPNELIQELELLYYAGVEEWEKQINQRAEKYITEVMWYTCPDFRI